jgi:diguanylate cyclase (GGDEF)-like protein
MAFKIEFFSIHRALVPLINLSKAIGGGGSCPYDKFADHLDSFIAMLRSKRSSIRPEMKLLAETIQRLWEDNLQLSRECYFDELTGLLNRRGFLNSVMPLLNLARRRASTVSITVIDIDFFKKVNDSYGHETGDKVLKAVANVIKNSLRDSDICARYGGEEFVVFYPEIRAGSSAFVSEKIRRAVETPIAAAIRLLSASAPTRPSRVAK